MNSTVLLVSFGVLALAGCLAMVWALLRQAAAHAAALQSNEQLRGQLGEATRLLTDMGREVAAVRAEAREEAERFRARAAQMQTEHLATLQGQVNNMAGLTLKQLEEIRRSMQERMVHLSGTVGEQLGSHTKVIMEVRGQLGGLAETAKNLQGLGKDIAGLQDILRAPKLRGNLGELFLEELLRQVLPSDGYSMQHRLPALHTGSHVTVDAVIHLGERMVPIDSKFPLESFSRLLDTLEDPAEKVRRRKQFIDVVCKHVDAVAEKYIRPDAGTYDFALMYLPAENVYYEAIVRDESSDGCQNVVAHAARRKVIPVSPNTFYAYLLTVSYGLKGLQIERQAEAMRDRLAALHKKFLAFYQVFEKVGRNLDLASRGYDDALKRASKLHDTMGKITGHDDDLAEPALQVGVPPAAGACVEM